MADTLETQPTVRCVSCGFLAKHGSRWHEAPPKERVSGYLSGDAGTGYDREWTVVIACFQHAFPLAQEYVTELGSIPELPNAENAHERICAANLTVIQRERVCGSWYQYIPGYSPKEHADRLLMMQLHEERQALAVRLAAIERESRSSLQKIEEDSLEIAKAIGASSEAIDKTTTRSDAFQTNATRWAIRIAIVASILAALVVAFTVLEYFHIQPSPSAVPSAITPSPTR